MLRCADLLFPYDGITRTGSKGLSQLRRAFDKTRDKIRRGTPKSDCLSYWKRGSQARLDAFDRRTADEVSAESAKVLAGVSVNRTMTAKKDHSLPLGTARRLAALFALMLPAVALSAAWQTVANEPGRRVEVDRDRIVTGQDGSATATGRIILDNPIVDPRTSTSYRIIEFESRYDCDGRSLSTLKRTYYKSEGEVLRQEEVRSPFEMPVRSGSPDDRILRLVCRPAGSASATQSVDKTLDKVNQLSGDLRKVNEALVAESVQKELRGLTPRAGKPAAATKRPVKSPASPKVSDSAAGGRAGWTYAGNRGPEIWGKLDSSYAVCAGGRRQSPIDLRDGIPVDLDPIQFFYTPSAFRVTDAVRQLQLTVYGGGMMLLGKQYQLSRVEFHAPSEYTVAGKAYAMEAQLIHSGADGKTAIVSVFLEPGTENPVIQTALNHLPLEKGGEVAPPGQTVDLNLLLPENKGYFTFMGSLTRPPCTEDVLWLVLKQPQQVSAQQLAIFQRLYPPNARPVQPAFGRIIKESR